jgi:sulfur relay protein TusB/DsrH
LSVLYILNTSAIDTLTRCLQRLTTDDALLLIESAVVIVNTGHLAEPMLANNAADNKIHVLEPDILARGIQLSKQLATIQCIDYNQFVSLVVEFNVTFYWK